MRDIYHIIISTYNISDIPEYMDPENPVVEEPQEKRHKKERKNHDENKKPKHPRPEYDRNADLITVDTVLEPLPKKNEILSKPIREECDEKAKKMREKITKLIDDKVCSFLYLEKYPG